LTGKDEPPRGRKPRKGEKWPTPKSSVSGPDYARINRKRSGGDDLATAVARRNKKWPTPCKEDGESHGARKGKPLSAQPLETVVRAGGPGSTWPTPRATEWKGCGPYGSKSQKYRLDRKYLDATVVEAEKAPSGGQLNPDWVERLMGLPTGWTDPERKNSEKVAYPKRWLDGTWEKGVPRLSARREWRRPRLMAVGNAVVPAQARVIAMWMLERIKADGVLT
jgi:hypothetical protein